ncbi:MAG: DNA repair protein RecO [Clostridia bacterium]|nr:DNA repair protein RecO [Clostridia bacterium]
MAEQLKTDGIVIREKTTGESDRLVTILTRSNGVIRAFARHAKNPKDNKSSGTSLLCYSDFTLSRGSKYCYVDSAKPKEVFFGLRNDIERLSLAQYFCELAAEFIPEDTDSSEFLRLMLNSLYFLAKTKKNAKLIKAITELRMISIAGYMPDLVGCRECGKYESESFYFLTLESCIYCKDCFDKQHGNWVELPYTVVHAMRHICYSDFEKIYSFNLADDALRLLAFVCEAYTVNTLGHTMNTLEFYKSIQL